MHVMYMLRQTIWHWIALDSDTCYNMVFVADGAGDPDGGNNMICIVVVVHHLYYTEVCQLIRNEFFQDFMTSYK